MIEPTFCGSRFSTGRLLAIEDFTFTATKPWLSGNMLPNIKTCENGWSNFSENLSWHRIWLRFLDSHPQIHQFFFNYVCCWGSLIVMLRFLNYPPLRSPFIEKSTSECVHHRENNRQENHQTNLLIRSKRLILATLCLWSCQCKCKITN